MITSFNIRVGINEKTGEKTFITTFWPKKKAMKIRYANIINDPDNMAEIGKVIKTVPRPIWRYDWGDDDEFESDDYSIENDTEFDYTDYSEYES